MLDVKRVKKKYYNNKFKSLLPTNKKKIVKNFWLSSLSKNIKHILISIGAFSGDTYTFVHPSQYSYLLGFKNNISYYNINYSSFLLFNALKFIKLARSDIKSFFVVVGSPRNYLGTSIAHRLNQLPNVEFFPSTTWKPGKLSKNSPASNTILILFNPTLHNDTLKEGIYSKIPIVSFVTPFCDIRGIDYPVLLNLKNQESWYLNLIYSVLSKQ